MTHLTFEESASSIEKEPQVELRGERGRAGTKGRVFLPEIGDFSFGVDLVKDGRGDELGRTPVGIGTECARSGRLSRHTDDEDDDSVFCRR